MELKFHVPEAEGEGEGEGDVSALVSIPDDVRFVYVMGHGAGAGMRHHFMERMSELLVARGVGTFRYQFPYMESGRKRPDTGDHSFKVPKRSGRTEDEVFDELADTIDDWVSALA